MIDICLNIFPQGSLDSSVITTVWVGIFVFAFFNLRFGWSLSGLIVPGYLVPLFLVRPWSATVVIVEAVLCYVLVLWLFEYSPRLGIWNSAFGRDRFFALLLVSVIVRLFLDGWLLPIIGEMVNDRFAINFDYQNHLYSFGLIIVALIANQFWKPGFFRGIIPFSVTVGTTYLLVRYVLMEWTNFSISNLGYMYEDIASSMLTSPKAYIILLTTAFIASQINLHYGWEYSGILVPSLIALLWYQPFKIVASFAETFVILGTAILILRLPVFKKTTIEGARKILLFFNISYAYKFLLAYLILWYMPEKKITDYYGFGYLLPCLLAMKMFDKDIIVRMTRMTIQTSFMAIMVASSVGFSLTLLPNLSAERYPSGDELEFERVRLPEKHLIDVIREEKIGLYQNRLKNRSQKPLPGDIEIFSEAIRKLLRYAERREPQVLAQAQWLLAKVQYRIQEVDTRYIYLYESERNRGWGLYAIDLNSSKQFVVEVPAPFTEWGTMEAGTWLFTMMEGKALAIAGAAAQKAGSSSLPSLNSHNSFFYAFHKEVALRDVVQVRGYTVQNVHALRNALRKEPEGGAPESESMLWVKSSLPPGLHLGKLKKFIGDFTIKWGKAPLKNVQREATGSGFAELYLDSSDMRKLFFMPRLAQHDEYVHMSERRVEGNLQDWLFAQKEKIAPQGSQGYIKPKLEELMFFDREILVPLLNMSHINHSSEQWPQADLEQLRAIQASAAVMGYEIVHFRQNVSNQEYFILVEQEQLSNLRHWGTYVIRLGNAHSYAIQIPRPLYETNVFEYSVSLFESLKARILLVSGSHKDANVDGSADVLRVDNIQNLFNLVNQVTLRESGDEPMMVLQARALGAHEDQPLPNVDIVLAFHNGVQNTETLSPLGLKLFDKLRADGVSLQFADGSPETAGYEAGRAVQSLYLNETRNKEFAILWLSPALRTHYRRQTENWWHEVQCQTLGIPTETSSLQSRLLEKALWETSEQVPQPLYEQLTHYISTHDIVALQAMIDRWNEFRFERFLDTSSGQAFLLVYSSRSKLMLVSNLFPRNVHNSYSISEKANVEETISRFIHTRSAWLRYEPQ